ncbi:hypothetical protein GCM10029963_40970 [Micromonospora andamanensis]
MTTVGPVDGGTARAAVTRLALRQIRRGALVMSALAAGTTAMVVAGYESTAGTALDAAALAALAENPAVRTLFGEPFALDTAGGFTVWRTGTVLAVLLSVWGCSPPPGSPGVRRRAAGGTCCWLAGWRCRPCSAGTSPSWLPRWRPPERRQVSCSSRRARHRPGRCGTP